MLIAENNYPLLEVFWTIIIFFAWLIWIWAVIAILSDVFRRHDIGGWGKAGWTFLVILLPFLGVLIYLIAEGKSMAERNAEQVKWRRSSTRSTFARSPAVAAVASCAEIANAKSLLDSGAITQEEFDRIKQRRSAERLEQPSRPGDLGCAAPAAGQHLADGARTSPHGGSRAGRP